jgi:hypothetical protein
MCLLLSFHFNSHSSTFYCNRLILYLTYFSLLKWELNHLVQVWRGEGEENRKTMQWCIYLDNYRSTQSLLKYVNEIFHQRGKYVNIVRNSISKYSSTCPTSSTWPWNKLIHISLSSLVLLNCTLWERERKNGKGIELLSDFWCHFLRNINF